MASLIDFILHIDKYLDFVTSNYGLWTYGILFLIVFCETGLVVTPFLPGDSLLFAAGAIASRGNLDPHVMAVLLIVAAILGDGLNYMIGFHFGPKLLTSENRMLRMVRRFLPLADYLRKTEQFFEKYGSKAVVFARFAPIVRTFAPFLAGIGKMRYPKFLCYNVVGGIAWVVLFVYAGYFFGETPVVKKNFTLVIMAIIVLSILPAVIEVWKAKREAKKNNESVQKPIQAAS